MSMPVNPMHPMPPLSPHAYWQKSRRATAILLLLWFAASFGMIFFATDLQNFSFFGWPLPFYALAQGLLIFFVGLTAAYARYMRHLNQRALAYPQSGDKSSDKSDNTSDNTL